MNAPKQRFSEIIETGISGKTIYVRVDYNVSFGENGVLDPSELYKIEVSVQTIRQLLAAGARVIIATHFGRAGADIKSLAPYIEKYFPVAYIPEWSQVTAQAIQEKSVGGAVVLLPNTRAYVGEESNSVEFAKLLGGLADVFVHEAFSVSHRDHASVSAIQTVLPSYTGIWHEQEISHLTRARHPELPALVIIGGAKFETKLSLIRHYIDMGAQVAVVGALAHAIYRTRGISIGQSLCDMDADVSEVLQSSLLWVPDEVVVQGVSSGVARTCLVSDVGESERIVDAGEHSAHALQQKIKESKSIIWNGPLGLYESGFIDATNLVKSALMESDAFRVIGGGDTMAIIQPDERARVATFCSTGGGAMLDFLVEG